MNKFKPLNDSVSFYLSTKKTIKNLACICIALLSFSENSFSQTSRTEIYEQGGNFGTIPAPLSIHRIFGLASGSYSVSVSATNSHPFNNFGGSAGGPGALVSTPPGTTTTVIVPGNELRLGYNLSLPTNTPQCATYSIRFLVQQGGLSGALVADFTFNIIINRSASRNYQNATAILTTPDLAIYDNDRVSASGLNAANLDYGFEPYLPSSWNWDYRNITQSPDIWNRKANDGSTQFENPTHSIASPQNANYMNVRIHNRSCVATPASELEMYWTIARNWEPWAADWWNYDRQVGGNSIVHQGITRPLGSEITIADIFDYTSAITKMPVAAFAPGEKRNIAHPWIVPSPEWYLNQPTFPIQFNRTFSTPVICLLARLQETWKADNGNPNDPSPSNALSANINIVDYVSQHNNFATRNTHIMNSTDGYKWRPIGQQPRTGGGVIAIVPQPADPGTVPPPTNIVIIADTPTVVVGIDDDGNSIEQPQLPINLANFGHLELFMDALLWEKWIAGGAQGENIEIIAEQVIRVTNPFRASLSNIVLAEGEMGWLATEAVLYEDAAPESNLQYHFSVGSFNPETGLTIGSPTHFELNVLANPTVENEVAENTLTSVNSLTNNDMVKVFPNPAKHKLYIEDKTINSQTVFTIYDMQGKLIKQVKGTKGSGVFEASLDIEGLTPGVYNLNVKTSEKQTSVRFIVEH